MVKHLDDRHCGAVGLVEVTQFHPNRTGPDNDQRLGLGLWPNRVAVLQHTLAINGHAGQIAGPCPRGDNKLIRGYRTRFGLGLKIRRGNI